MVVISDKLSYLTEVELCSYKGFITIIGNNREKLYTTQYPFYTQVLDYTKATSGNGMVVYDILVYIFS